MNREKIGKLISKLRKEKSLTQEQLAELLGIESKTISRWENGKSSPDITIINKLAEILDVDTYDLLEGFQSKNEDEKINQVIQVKLENFKIEENVNLEKIKEEKKNNIKKEYKRKKIIIISTVLIFSFIFCIISFSATKNIIENKYNSIKFTSNDSKYLISGTIIHNNKKQYIILNKTILQKEFLESSKEQFAKNIHLYLINDNEPILYYHYENTIDDYGNEKVYKLSEILEKLSTQVVEIEAKTINQLSLKIIYINENDESIEEIINLDKINS